MVFRSDILEVNLAASCKILILLLASLTISSVFLFHFKSDVMIVPEAVGETLQKKDVEINLLRKQITEYERERREMLKGFNLARFIIKNLKLIAPEVSTLEQQIVERIICFICTVHLDDWDSFYSGRTEEVTNEISMEIDNISDKEGASDPPSPVCSVCGKCCWDPHNRMPKKCRGKVVEKQISGAKTSLKKKIEERKKGVVGMTYEG